MNGQIKVKSLRERIIGYRIGRLGRNTLLGSAGLGARAIIQAGYLVLLSHWLGVHGYGFFAGWIAMVGLVAPLSGWGIALLLMQDVARDRTRSRASWATALVQIALTGAALVVLIMLVAAWLPQEHQTGTVALLLLSVAELVLLPAAQAATGLCFTLDFGALAALAMCIVPAARVLMGLVFFCMQGTGTFGFAAWSHFIGSVIGLGILAYMLTRVDGSPVWSMRTSLRETMPRGSAYAVGALVGQSYQEVDKALMLQLLGAAVVGQYTVAFRVISVFALPVSALVGAALPRLFAAHEHSSIPRATLRAVIIASFIYGVIAAFMAVCVVPLIPAVFGKGFSDAMKYLLLLSPWPILFALHQSTAAGLMAMGRQRARVFIEGIGLALTALLNLLLLNSFGAIVSVLALLITEAFMALGCWLCQRK